LAGFSLHFQQQWEKEELFQRDDGSNYTFAV
jgi:hypothetical protein